MEDDVADLFSGYYEISKAYAEVVVKRYREGDREPLLKELDTALLEVAEVDRTVREESEVLRKTEHELSQNMDSEWGDLSEMLDENLAKLPVKDVTKCKNVTDYRSHVKSLINSSELAEMIVMSSETNIDPYTKKPIEQPVRIRSCKHTFDKASITQVLAASGRGKLRCPYIGCQHWFTAKDLTDDCKQSDSDEDV